MTFTFAQPLKILVIGGSLITSTSFWFFNPSSPIAPLAQTRSPEQPKAKVSAAIDDDENINSFDSVDKLSDKTGTIIEDTRIKNITFPYTSYISYTPKDSTIPRYLSFLSLVEIKEFELKNVMGKRSQYRAIGKEDIKIYLFKEHAFFSETHKDEYESNPLEQSQIEELFDGLDETKTKQLLLSLQKNIEWDIMGSPTSNPIYYFGREIHRSVVDSPSVLTELKIKHFKEFNSLKDYVQKKVKGSCQDNKKACVAHPKELDTYKTDTLKYFNNQ